MASLLADHLSAMNNEVLLLDVTRQWRADAEEEIDDLNSELGFNQPQRSVRHIG
jgi:hypothetical protein